eukprot:1100693-Amphidinium_carterae.1
MVFFALGKIANSSHERWPKSAVGRRVSHVHEERYQNSSGWIAAGSSPSDQWKGVLSGPHSGRDYL